MTRVILIPATPTPWDVEGRLGGNPMLPLTPEGEAALREAARGLSPAPEAVYAFTGNQACGQAAEIVAAQFGLKVRHSDYLEPVSMGLWQGLTRDELRFRFPTVFPEWEENPLGVNPPEGESLADAAGRFREGVRKVVKRNRDETVVLVLRPLSVQIVAGILRGQDIGAIATDVKDVRGIETIEVSDEAADALVD